MSASLTFHGLDKLKDALRDLPKELAVEAGHLIEAAANGAAAEIRSQYPYWTGNLRNHVRVELNQGVFGARARVLSTARHAHLFEFGTAARHYVTKAGKRHLTGAMPPNHVFIQSSARKRRQMYENLKDLLRRNGLIVVGDE